MPCEDVRARAARRERGTNLFGPLKTGKGVGVAHGEDIVHVRTLQREQGQRRSSRETRPAYIRIDGEVLLRCLVSLDVLTRREEKLALDHRRFRRLGILLSKRFDVQRERLEEGRKLGVDGSLTAGRRSADWQAGDGIGFPGRER